jgi:hypothetical protein
MGRGRRRPERDTGRFGPGPGRDRRHDTGHTTAPADQYNVFFQLDNGDWMVQSFGADTNAFGLQSDFVAVPEPGTLALLGTGFLGLLGVAGRNRRGGRVVRKQSKGLEPVQPRALDPGAFAMTGRKGGESSRTIATTLMAAPCSCAKTSLFRRKTSLFRKARLPVLWA